MWPSQGLSLRLSMRVVSVVSGEWPGDSLGCPSAQVSLCGSSGRWPQVALIESE